MVGGEGGSSDGSSSSGFPLLPRFECGTGNNRLASFRRTSLGEISFSATSSRRSMEPSLLTRRLRSSLSYFHERGCMNTFFKDVHTVHYIQCVCTVIYNVLYGDDSSQSQSSNGNLGEFTGIEGQSGKIMCQGGKPDTGKFHSSYIGMNVCGSAYKNGCVVDGMCATAAD